MATNETECVECYNECYDCDAIPVNSQTCLKLHEYNDVKIQLYSSIFNATTNPGSLPKILAKLSANLWCLNSNEIALLCNLKTRMEIAEQEIIDLKDRMTKAEQEIVALKNRVTKVESDIQNLDNKIDAMQGTNFTTLTKGTDYDITFRNGWSTPSNDMTVKVSAASGSTSVQIFTSADLANADLKSTTIAHASAIGSADWLNSRICTVTFKGRYAPLNTGRKFAINGDSLFNIRPTSAQASWSYVAGSGQDDGGQSFTVTSYSDGYNTQFTRYTDAIYSVTSNFKYHWTTDVNV